jgi:hypothetical protein
MVRTSINTAVLISLLLVITLISCKKKQTPEEPLAFTDESHDYTAEQGSALVDHLRFADITKEAGINFKHITGAFGAKWMPETLGSGGGFLDYDNDGWIDILLINSCEWEGHKTGKVDEAPKLFRNNGNNTFTDVSKKAGLSRISTYGMGASFADFDADGDQDIYITAVGPNLLLRNDNGLFTDVTTKMHVAGNDQESGGSPEWSTSSAWVDVDRDGWLDLFVSNYVKWSPETDIYTTIDGKTKSYATPDVYEGQSCRLYKNIRGESFEDITKISGILNDEGKSLGVAVEDFNNDMWPDLVISNDTQPNFLYINNGDGTFNNVAVPSGIAYDENGRARAGMGIDVADIDNNEKLAIAIGNFSQEPLSLYTQTQNGDLFHDRAGAARITRPTLLQLTFGVLFADFDLDGYKDLITANGHIEPEINAVQKNITFAQRTQIFYNGKSGFIEISDRAGPAFADAIVGRGIAAGDMDNDGDPDILITVNGDSPRLLRNDLSKMNRYLKITLKGKSPNINAIGAKVVVWTNGMRQQKMLRTGSSYLTQSDVSSLIFGLGDQPKADSLAVFWPVTGIKENHYDLSAGNVTLTER